MGAGYRSVSAFYSLPASITDSARAEESWLGTGGETKHSLEGERPHAPPPAPVIALSAANCRTNGEANSGPGKKDTWARAPGLHGAPCIPAVRERTDTVRSGELC